MMVWDIEEQQQGGRSCLVLPAGEAEAAGRRGSDSIVNC